MNSKGQASDSSEMLISSKEYFNEIVADAFEQRQLKTYPSVSTYLTNLLEFYINTENLYEDKDEGMMAEKLLKASNAEPSVRAKLLRRLGDTSLYISGFFGDSLKRKIVDVDYYADIGGTAYHTLAGQISDDLTSKIYTEMAGRFLEFVDVLTYISQKVLIQTNGDLLRLYDRYISTGSKLAMEQLLERGLLTPDIKKGVGQ